MELLGKGTENSLMRYSDSGRSLPDVYMIFGDTRRQARWNVHMNHDLNTTVRITGNWESRSYWMQYRRCCVVRRYGVRPHGLFLVVLNTQGAFDCINRRSRPIFVQVVENRRSVQS